MQMPTPSRNHRKRYALRSVQSANADHVGFSRFPMPPALASGVFIFDPFLSDFWRTFHRSLLISVFFIRFSPFFPVIGRTSPL